MTLQEATKQALSLLIAKAESENQKQSLRVRRRRLERGEMKEGGQMSIIREAFPNAEFQIDVKFNKDPKLFNILMDIDGNWQKDFFQDFKSLETEFYFFGSGKFESRHLVFNGLALNLLEAVRKTDLKRHEFLGTNKWGKPIDK